MFLSAPVPAAFQDTVLDHLTPHFVAATDGDQAAARHVARGLLVAYDTRTDAELELAVAIADFSLHALQALSESMAPDLTLNQKLRLRSSAVSLSRESHKARRKLDQLVRARGSSVAPRADAAAEPAILAAPLAGGLAAGVEPLADRPAANTESLVVPEHPATAESSAASPASAPPPPRNPVHRPHRNSALPPLTRSQQLRHASQTITENLRRNAAIAAAQAAAVPPDAESRPAVT